jgi:hypothetical protein
LPIRGTEQEIYLQTLVENGKIRYIHCICKHQFEYKFIALQQYKLFRLTVVSLRDLTLCRV